MPRYTTRKLLKTWCNSALLIPTTYFKQRKRLWNLLMQITFTSRRDALIKLSNDDNDDDALIQIGFEDFFSVKGFLMNRNSVQISSEATLNFQVTVEEFDKMCGDVDADESVVMPHVSITSLSAADTGVLSDSSSESDEEAKLHFHGGKPPEGSEKKSRVHKPAQKRYFEKKVKDPNNNNSVVPPSEKKDVVPSAEKKVIDPSGLSLAEELQEEN